MADPIRILFCRSNAVAPDPRVEKEANTLAVAGYSVRVLAWDRSGTLPFEGTLPGEPGAKVNITRLAIVANFGSGMQNFPALLRWQFGLLGWMRKNKQRFDIIHACDFDTILPALFMRRFQGKKVVYDIFDFYADHLRRTPSLIKRLIRAIDLWAINTADAVILADETRKDQIKGSSPRRLAIIYNSPQDIGRRFPRVASEKRQLSIVYIGLLQLERGLGELLQVLKSHPDWKLDLAGFGGDEAAILEGARMLSNVKWHGKLTYEKAIELSAAADVLLATYDPAIPNHRYSSPNKLFEAMMLGKPIVVARGTNMDKVVDKWKIGQVVDYGDASSLEKALETLHKSDMLRNEMGSRARQAYETKYSWKQMENNLVSLYSELTPQKH